MHTLVVYDIESDKIRKKVITACKDYGLTRIQFSAFLGEIGHNHRQELEKKIKKIMGQNRGKVNFFPLCDKDFALVKEIVVGEMSY